jgi:hypothetical protein
VKLFERLTREAPKRIDAAKLARSQGLPANRTFALQFTDEPDRALYLYFQNDRPMCSTTARAYDARILMSVNTLLQVLDKKLTFDEAIAWSLIEVIPKNAQDYTQFDLEASRKLLFQMEDFIRETALG